MHSLSVLMRRRSCSVISSPLHGDRRTGRLSVVIVNDGILTVASCNAYKSQQNTLQLAAVPHTPVVCPTILARPSEHGGQLSRRWPLYNAAVYKSFRHYDTCATLVVPLAWSPLRLCGAVYAWRGSG